MIRTYREAIEKLKETQKAFLITERLEARLFVERMIQRRRKRVMMDRILGQ